MTSQITSMSWSGWFPLLNLVVCNLAMAGLDVDFIPIGTSNVPILPGNVIRSFPGGEVTYLVRARVSDPESTILGGTVNAHHLLDVGGGEAITGHECLSNTGTFCDDGVFNPISGLTFQVPPSSTPFTQLSKVTYSPADDFRYGESYQNSEVMPVFDVSWIENGVTHSAIVEGDPTVFQGFLGSGPTVQINLTSQLVMPRPADLTVSSSGAGATRFAYPLDSSFNVVFDEPQEGTIRVAMRLSDYTPHFEGIPGTFSTAVDADLAALGSFNLMYTFEAAYVDQFTMRFEGGGCDPIWCPSGRPEVHSLAVSSLPAPTSGVGDFNKDGRWDLIDLEALVHIFRAGAFGGYYPDPIFDVNGDGFVSWDDVTDPEFGWLAIAGAHNPALTGGDPFLPGDANLDGIVDGADFLAWDSNKFGSSVAWSAGNFDRDWLVDGSDFLIWNENKFTSANTNDAVPEPRGWILLAAALFWLRRGRAR